jgi:hypothetical protein
MIFPRTNRVGMGADNFDGDVNVGLAAVYVCYPALPLPNPPRTVPIRTADSAQQSKRILPSPVEGGGTIFFADRARVVSAFFRSDRTSWVRQPSRGRNSQAAPYIAGGGQLCGLRAIWRRATLANAGSPLSACTLTYAGAICRAAAGKAADTPRRPLQHRNGYAGDTVFFHFNVAQGRFGSAESLGLKL